jgi:C4-dicarboxylate-specific signal transduction histidine kinase
MSEAEALKIRIKALEDELKRLRDQLAQSRRMEHLGRYAGSVAHDLNNLMAGIVTYPEVVLMELPAESPLKKHLYAIKQAGERQRIL